MTDPEPATYDHLIPAVTREFAAVSGGHQLGPADARALCRRLLAGRAVASPAAYVVQSVRSASDPFALLDDPPPRRREHPSARPVADAWGPGYGERLAAVRAHYAEDARRKAAGEPPLWREREAAARASAAEQAAAWHASGQAMNPAAALGAPAAEPVVIDPDAWDAGETVYTTAEGDPP